MDFVVTWIDSPSVFVRILKDNGLPDYQQGIIVTIQDEGETLYLTGWIGTPLTPGQWREGKKALFPGAKRVKFERRNNGKVRYITLEFKDNE